MTGRYGGMNFELWAKGGFLLGIGLLIIGELGEFLIRTYDWTVPQWEHTLLFAAAGAGILIALLSPFVFGIILPLTD